MESKIFAQLNFDPGILVIVLLLLVIVLAVMTILLLMRQSRLEFNYKLFMRGHGGKSIEETLKQRLEDIDKMTETTDLLHKRVTYVEKSLNRSYQKFGLIKYDAFKEMGGELSFALALLNDSNTGFVINCIHGREGSYNYIKEIIRGESKLPLCQEETDAIENAIKGIQTQTEQTPSAGKAKLRKKEKAAEIPTEKKN